MLYLFLFISLSTDNALYFPPNDRSSDLSINHELRPRSQHYIATSMVHFAYSKSELNHTSIESINKGLLETGHHIAGNFNI